MSFDYNYLRTHTDYTNLSVTATSEDIEKLCKKAMNYKTATICIAPCWVSFVKKHFPEIHICTVIGFPNGYSTTEVKVLETINAINNGADEIDMVINQGWTQDERYWENIKDEVSAIRECCKMKDKVLKVIFEICNMTGQQVKEICKICSDCKVDYVKTSTGFGKSGANEETAKLMAEYAVGCKVKAAGGIRTCSQAEIFLSFCDRIGASSNEIIELHPGETVKITHMGYGTDSESCKIGVVSHKNGEVFVIIDKNDKEKCYSVCDYTDTFEVL